MGPGNTRVRPYKGGSFALRKLNMDASQAEFIFLVQFFSTQFNIRSRIDKCHFIKMTNRII